MAGDRIYFDHDFPEKTEVVTLSQDMGVTIGEIMVRCHRLWRHFDRHSPDGFLENLGPIGVGILCGGDEAFWIRFAELGWLIFHDGGCEMPGFTERLDSGKGCAYKRMRTGDELRAKAAERKRRERMRKRGVTTTVTTTVTTPVTTPVTFVPSNLVPRTSNQEPRTSATAAASAVGGAGGGSSSNSSSVDWERAKQIANETIRAVELAPARDGKYRRLIIQAAALSFSVFDATWLSDAVEDTKRKGTDRSWAYFRKCLASGATARGGDLDRLLAGLVVPERFLTAPSKAKPEAAA